MSVSMSIRQRLLANVAQHILKLPKNRVARVAIDGVDGEGKTFFADELASVLSPSGRQVIRASVDSFHNSRAVRYRLGKDSPRGFFEDSYNYPELKRVLLDPLSPGGSSIYRTASFDYRMDSPVHAPEIRAEASAILIFDGIFLHRPELRDYWDYSVFLKVDFDVSIPRGAQRGEGSPDPKAPENRRYLEGQKIYLRECEPKWHATVVINNNDLGSPYFSYPRTTSS